MSPSPGRWDAGLSLPALRVTQSPGRVGGGGARGRGDRLLDTEAAVYLQRRPHYVLPKEGRHCQHSRTSVGTCRTGETSRSPESAEAHSWCLCTGPAPDGTTRDHRGTKFTLKGETRQHFWRCKVTDEFQGHQ